MATEIPNSLSKIGKKKRKFLAKRLKDCDPSKIEELLKGGIPQTEVVKSFKNKPNKKRKKKKYEQGKPDASKDVEMKMKVEIPKNAAEASSNWANLVSRNLAKTEDLGPKEKPIFYRRKKNGEIITNDPNLKKAVPDAVKKASLDAAKTQPDEVWFDDVDPVLLDVTEKGLVGENDAEEALVKAKSFTGLTKVLGMDCEMVGVGRDGTDSVLARVSIVNHFGHPVYDKFVSPREKVTDYRTAVSGVRPSDLVNAPEFTEVQAEVSKILKGRVIVGHALNHDFKVLFLDHPRKLIRDTSKYKPFKVAFGNRTPSLKNLTARFLGVSVQSGEHSSVQDSQAAVRLYTMHRKEWEAALEAKRTVSASNRKVKARKNKKDNTEKNFAPKVEVPVAEGESRRAMYCPSDSE